MLDLAGSGLRPTTNDTQFLGDDTHAWKRADINALYLSKGEFINYTANNDYQAFYGVDVTPNDLNPSFLLKRDGKVQYLLSSDTGFVQMGHNCETNIRPRVQTDVDGTTIYGGTADSATRRALVTSTDTNLYAGGDGQVYHRLTSNASGVSLLGGTSISAFRINCTATATTLYAGTATTAVKRFETLPASVSTFTSNGTTKRIYTDDTGVSLYGGAVGTELGRFSCNNNGIGFFGTAPVARPTWTAPTGTPSRTALSATETNAAVIAAKVVALITDLRAYGLFG
jgi:hypothetical protein